MEGFRYFLEIDKCDIPLAPFDATQIGPIQSAHVRKRLLRDTHSSAPMAQSLTEADSDIFHLRFEVMLCSPLFMCPRTMSIISK
jgi:hypothetical protein